MFKNIKTILKSLNFEQILRDTLHSDEESPSDSCRGVYPSVAMTTVGLVMTHSQTQAP